jgi:endoglucanase
VSAPGFAGVRDGAIVDGAGHPLMLRGMGLGNWLLAEGYMWGLSPGRESAREIEALIVELVGTERAERFWVDFRDRFVSFADIEQIAVDGFDHVRLPINWRIVIDDDGNTRPGGFDRIDDLIGWCRDAGLRVLLDLHGAPGGQTGTNIDDSRGRPELFMDDRYADLTERLWIAIASRYRDEPVVLGYDLLNEPLPDEWQHRYAEELVEMYARLTAAIRTVDDRHLIMYEGSHWGTNWSMFTEVWDDNSVLQFHKYWSPPDRPSIQRFIDVGERLGLPIYMGEGGENNTDWLATAFQLYEDHGIGWCFWPWKKLATRTSPCSIRVPPGWDTIVAYANGAAPPPDPEAAWAILRQLAAAGSIEQCEYRTDVVNAVFRRAPLSLPATAFGFRGPGRSHSAGFTSRSLPGFRADDGVRIELGNNSELPAFDHTDGTPDHELIVRLEEQEWVAYSVEILVGTHVDVLTDDTSRPPVVNVDGVAVPPSATSPGRHSYRFEQIAPGRHEIQVIAGVGGCALRRLDIVPIPDREITPT